MSKIRLRILGTTAGVPTKQRAHAAIHLSYTDKEEFCCLFDCGEGTQRQFLNAGLHIMKINDIFVTHWHGDHCLGIPGMVDTMGFEGRQEPVNIYSPEVKRAKKCVNFINHSMGKVKIRPYKVSFRGKKEFVLMDTEHFKIVSIPVKHSIPAVAYAFIEKDKKSIDLRKAAALGLPAQGEVYKKIREKGRIVLQGKEITIDDISTVNKGKKIVYSGDTDICDSLKELVKGADLLIQDCTYFEEKDETCLFRHASLPEVTEMVKESGVKKTILTHISRRYKDAEELKACLTSRTDMEIAEDFMEIEV